MLGRTDRRFRMVALLLAFTVFGGAAALRLGYWQVLAAPELQEKAERSMPREREADVFRADIVYRSGVVLAQTASLDRLVAYPVLIPESRGGAVVAERGRIMGIAPGEATRAYAGKLS